MYELEKAFVVQPIISNSPFSATIQLRISHQTWTSKVQNMTTIKFFLIDLCKLKDYQQFNNWNFTTFDSCPNECTWQQQASVLSMKSKTEHTAIFENEFSHNSSLTSTAKRDTENWFKHRRTNLIKFYELLPKSWLQRVYFFELFLIIGDLDGNPKYGITDYFEMIETRSCTTKTLSTFLNERIAEGDLVLVQSLKKSRKTYRLSSELREICKDLAR